MQWNVLRRLFTHDSFSMQEHPVPDLTMVSISHWCSFLAPPLMPWSPHDDGLRQRRGGGTQQRKASSSIKVPKTIQLVPNFITHLWIKYILSLICTPCSAWHPRYETNLSDEHWADSVTFPFQQLQHSLQRKLTHLAPLSLCPAPVVHWLWVILTYTHQGQLSSPSHASHTVLALGTNGQ